VLRLHQGSAIDIAQELGQGKWGQAQSQGGQARSKLLTRLIGPGQDRDGDRHPVQRETARSPNRRNTRYEVLQATTVAWC
jgi:hypothetical protein